MKILAGEPRLARVSELNLHPDNARQGDVGIIHQSILDNGFFGRILVQKSTGYIIAGNHRFQAAVHAGAEEVPVEVLDIDDDRARRILLVDNRSNDLAGYNEGALADLLRRLHEETNSLAGTGYDLDDLDELLAAIGEEPTAKEDDAEPAGQAALDALQALWGTKPGQVWRIPSLATAGECHRIACIDSTDPAAVERLMADKRATLVYTDPPYGVDYESDHLGKIANDALAGTALERLLRESLTLAAEHSTDNAAFYIWHASSTRGEFERAMAAAGLQERQYIIWVKDSFVLGRAHYHWQHEPCFYAGKKGQRPYFTDDRSQSTVWRVEAARIPGVAPAISAEGGIVLVADDGARLYVSTKPPKTKKVRPVRLRDRDAVGITTDDAQSDVWSVTRDPSEDYLHPTQKPVELAIRAIRNSSEVGGLVLDLFHGGGATAVAAEMTGRLCHAAELDPRFVAYNLQRLADLGLTPMLDEEGEEA